MSPGSDDYVTVQGLLLVFNLVLMVLNGGYFALSKRHGATFPQLLPGIVGFLAAIIGACAGAYNLLSA